MSRRRRVTKREIDVDQKLESDLVAAFVNCLMKGGKKGVAERMMYGALEIIEEKPGSRRSRHSSGQSSM